MKIPIMKATARSILGLLECIDGNEGDIGGTKDCIHQHLQKLSVKERQRNIRSDVYGVALPSLRKLQLIIGHGSFLRLNCNGKLLLKSFSLRGFDEFKSHFRRIIYEIDNRKCKVISSLREVLDSKPNHDAATYEQLVSSLVKKGIETHENDERLRKWLPFLEYVDLIKTVDENSLHVNFDRVRDCERKGVSAPFELFERLFFEEYEKLEVKEGIYIPIFALRDNVCIQLIEKGHFFNTFDFEKLLIILLGKYSSLESKKILLSQPGKREEDGMYVDNTYYYFISIYDVKEQ